ncbi:MAG: hypothetical protein U9P37_03660 [Pseudomonadota bacterium]|nr:hypothetical protein [Pseudomonadota bacterium]
MKVKGVRLKVKGVMKKDPFTGQVSGYAGKEEKMGDAEVNS